jgi:hypothetical protein
LVQGQGKRFFFEKKKQKTLYPFGLGGNLPRGAAKPSAIGLRHSPARRTLTDEVFLLLFFQKKKRLLPLSTPPQTDHQTTPPAS